MEDTQKVLQFAMVVIENRLLGRLIPILSTWFTFDEIADIFQEATSRHFSKERINQLNKKYGKKGGEKNV